jgi:hypothetical protein
MLLLYGSLHNSEKLFAIAFTCVKKLLKGQLVRHESSWGCGVINEG